MLRITSSPLTHVFACLFIAASSTFAGVTAHIGDDSLIVDETNSASFNDLTHGQSLMDYTEDGLRVSANRTYFSWDAPGLDGSPMFYSNTGALEMVDISLTSGADFHDLDMQIASGWSPDSIGTVFTWVQLYDDGMLVQEFDLDFLAGSYVGLVGGGFDQILIGSYVTGDIRDLHNPSERNAIAIDNIHVGTFVPTPGSAVLLSIGLLFGSRRSRNT